MKVQNNLTYVEIDGLNYPDSKDVNQVREIIFDELIFTYNKTE